MKAKGKTLLRITGFLELAAGALMLALLFWVMDQTDPEVLASVGFDIREFNLWHLIISYGGAAFSILAGLIGMINAGKPQHYKVCMVFGMLLILFAMGNYTYGDLTLQRMMTNIGVTIIPVFYYYGAVLNKQSC